MAVFMCRSQNAPADGADEHACLGVYLKACQGLQALQHLRHTSKAFAKKCLDGVESAKLAEHELLRPVAVLQPPIEVLLEDALEGGRPPPGRPPPCSSERLVRRIGIRLLLEAKKPPDAVERRKKVQFLPGDGFYRLQILGP